MICTWPYLEEQDIVNIKIPFIQVIGFEATVSVVSLKDKGVYVVEDLMTVHFPTSKKHIRQGGIIELIKALSLIQQLLENLRETMEEGKNNTGGNKMLQTT